jgi:oligosaccharide translocation protein RFT1
MNDDNLKSVKAKSYILNTVTNTTLFVMMSVVTKIINLIFNILILRNVTKESYALATVYFGLIFVLLLYFPRETIRKTCIKYCPDENEVSENEKFIKACSMAWILNILVLAISAPLFLIFVMYGGESLQNNKIHLLLFIFSALLELTAEPIIIYMNIKLDNNSRLIAMLIGNYTRIVTNYLYIILFDMQIWSFTLSRLTASFAFTCFMFYLALFKYKLGKDALLPNYKYMYEVYNYAEEMKALFRTFSKATFLRMVLNYTERLILSFFLTLNDVIKADYTFIVENFAILVKYFIEPAEENFFNLVNKLKNYKNITVLTHDLEGLSGDFSLEESSIMIGKCPSSSEPPKELNQSQEHIKSTMNKKDLENYSFKLLRLSLKFFFIFLIFLFGYLFLIGEELIIFVFSEKWATPGAIAILKVYTIYVGLIGINGIMESYTNAICTTLKINTYNYFMIINGILLVFLSYYLTRGENILGLVYANIITFILRIFMNMYLIVTTEIEYEVEESRGLTQTNKQIDCIKAFTSLNILCQTFKFVRKSFLKTPALISTLFCLYVLYMIKEMNNTLGGGHIFLLMIGSSIIFSVNCFLIFIIERKGFIEIMRIK